MKKNETIELSGIITDMHRLPTSYMGNPKFQFVIDGTIVETMTNCSYGYSIQNYDNGKPIKIKAKIYRNKLTLTSIEKV